MCEIKTKSEQKDPRVEILLIQIPGEKGKKNRITNIR